MSSGKAPNVRGVDSPGRRTVFSMCGMCGTRCPIEVTVEDGRVVWLQGNPNDTAINASLCARGAASIPFEYDDERPQTPLIRTGPRGAGQWRRASWDEALDHICDKLRETIEACGPRGIALSDRGGGFADLTKAFVQALGSPNYFDHDAACGSNAHNAALSLYGVGRAAIAFDLRNAKHLVLYGRNIVESLMVKEAKDFMAAISRGMHCTYIDPRVTTTACKATRYWQLRPNSDYALNLAIIHEVLKQEVYDKDFVERFVSGMDVLREAVKDTTPEWQEQHTGIAADHVRAFVAEIALDAPQVIFHPGWMVARHKQSFYVSRTALILNALMGSIEVRGGCVLAKTPEDVGHRGLKKLVDRSPKVNEARIDGAGTTRPHWDPDAGALHQLFAALETGQPYGIGAYFAYRHDPLTGMPDPEAAQRALDKLKLLVAIDVRYSETAWFADVVLPESSYLERANVLCQNNGPRPNFGMRDQAVAPRFDSRPAWWIFREILRRMGVNEALDFETIEELWDYQLEGTGITVAQMRENGIVSLADAAAITPRDKLKFKTPSGKIEIVSAVLNKAGLPSLPPYEVKEAPSMAGSDRFYLLFGRPATLTHGQSLNNPILNEIAPEQTLWIHPDRAKALGIADGDEVEINGGGKYSAYIKAEVTPMVHPEAVFMLHGYGATVPLATRACGLGVADQRLQHGKLYEFDPAGGGNAMTETIVTLKRKGARA
jgi:thiosulfate reductase / polysulfide reductase chain A